jgi:hypothetical protein
MPAGFRWPDGVRAAACLTFDVDAESPILFDHPETADWLDVMSHQAYGARTGIARLLRVLDRRGVRGTFFIPGYSAERWPDICRSIRDAGHEIAHHGYLHEGAHGADVDEQERRLVRGLAALDEVLGVRPVGYRGPNWELTFDTPRLLAKHGFVYDSGMMDADHPYLLAVDETPNAATLVELPGHWSLDDWEPYNYLPGITGSGVIASPADVIDRWLLELEALVADGGLFIARTTRSCRVVHPGRRLSTGSSRPPRRSTACGSPRLPRSRPTSGPSICGPSSTAARSCPESSGTRRRRAPPELQLNDVRPSSGRSPSR